MSAVKNDRKCGSPIGGLIARFMLLGVNGIGLVTGRMPLGDAANQGIELDRWPIAFWAYTAIICAFGVAVLAGSVWALAKERRDG